MGLPNLLRIILASVQIWHFNVNRKKLLIVSSLTAIAIAALVLGLVLGLRSEDPPPTRDAPSKILTGGAVTSNGPECAPIGARILRANGSAVDAAIAVMLCEEVTCPQSTGLGGGFLATVYSRETGSVVSLDARETAPLAATEDMFVGNGEAAAEGGLAIATPGVLAGFWELHQRFGKLPWRELFEPTIELCRKGVKVNSFLVDALEQEQVRLTTIPSLREVFVNPATGDVWKEGDVMKREVLADALEVMAKEGSEALHGEKGSLLPKLLDDLKGFGSILTREDFLKYRPRWLPSAATTIRQNYSVFSMPLPGSGTIAIYMLNLLDTFDDLNPDDPESWHYVAESFKHGYGARTKTADPDYVPELNEFAANLTSKTYAEGIRKQIFADRTFEDFAHYGAEFVQPDDHGTAHVSVLAPNGDAVALTATVNTYFGCKRRSPSTGMILNNIMDDFATPGVINSFGVPASPVNFVAPGKRPLSSMTPTIVTDANGDVRLVLGAAGGTRITTSTVLLVLRTIFFGQDLDTAMNAPRLHHQLAPETLDVERAFAGEVVEGLTKKGHKVRLVSGIGTATAIARERDGSVSAAFDPKRGGSWEIIP